VNKKRMVNNDKIVPENRRTEEDRAARSATESASFFLSVFVLVLSLSLFGSFFVTPALAAIVNEPMTGATAPGWVIGGSAYLSASTGVDPVGNGWLRLTEPLNDQAGFAFFDAPFDISQGVVITFDYATWGGNGADGYSIYLFDGSYDASTFLVGASGGSLGYDKKTVAPVHAGLTGGYIGIGIDEYGNYSNPSEGRIGGPGQQANEVGVRGPFDHPSGAYFWLGGSGVLGTQLAFNNQLFRPLQTSAQYRKVVINLTPVAAPNYLRVDTYVQFGYNQPLTPVVTGLNVGRPVPASVKVGYAASTGGSTNYHEIRNLEIDPLQTDIDLSMTKVASSPTVTRGGVLTYTVTARNYGPANTTATNVPITDTIPALLTGATWTCTGSGGATCGAATGSGNINTTATIPFNGAATYAIRSTVSITAPFGSVITNTATLTPPAGITDYNSANNSASASTTVTGPTVTVSGMVYNDANHDGVRGGGEVSSNIAAIYAKLFRSNDLTTTLSVVAVNQAAGTYTFNNVPSYGNYTIILSSTNTANTYDPSFPSAQWIYTSPVSYTLSNVAVGGVFLTSQDFGVYNGTRFDGRVFKDDGINGSLANANDGIQNAAETGIAGVPMSICNNAACAAIDTTTTDAAGNYALYINWGNAFTTGTARITQTVPGGYLMVNYNPGTATGTAVNVGLGYVTFTFNRGTDRSGILFGDAQSNTFTPATQALNGDKNTSVYFGHTFTPGSGGSVSFAATSRSQGTWPVVVYYQDMNCNGSFDVSDITLPATLTASAGSPICILVKDTIPAGAVYGATDQIVTRATFTYTNSVGPVVAIASVTDTTTVTPSGPTVSVSGRVYGDANHNGILDGAEGSPNLAGIYAKLFKSSDLTSMLSVTAVVQSAGTYTFNLVPTNDTYTIILSSTSTTAYDPSFPNTQWVATSPANYTLLGVTVGSSNLANQNFGVFNGTRIDGIVLEDDGAATGANANNGVQNAGETGITGQTISICDHASCASIDTETTDALGAFSLFIPWTTNFATARVTQTSIPVNYSMVNYNPGNAAGSGVNLGSRYVTFTFTRGNDVTGLVYSDVPDNTFTPTPLAQTGSQTAQLYYAHTFTPGSGGTVSFASNLRSQATWTALVYYQDTNCNGVYDGGDVPLPASLSMTAGTPVCILVKDTILSSAPTGTTDQIVTRATFTFTNSSGPVVRTYDVTDTTTVQTPGLGTSTKTWTDLSGGPGGSNVYPGDVLQYTITLINSSATVTAYGVQATDTLSANLTSLLVVSIPAGATDASTATTVDIRNITVPPSTSVTIVVNATVAATSGTVPNTANITYPVGAGPAVASTTATIVTATGNKPLYFYGGAASPYLFSRTTPSAVAPNTTAVAIANNTSAVWSLQTQPLKKDVTITGNVPLTLYLRGAVNNRSYNVTATLDCSSTWGANVFTGSTAITLFTATTTTTNVTMTSPAPPRTCAAGNYLSLTVLNNASGAGRTINLYPVDASLNNSISRVVLPTSTVIAVDSVNSYISTYPSTTAPALGYFVGGQTVYVRAVVSDPFGSFDIVSAPTVTIKDPSNNPVVGAVMTLKNDSGQATKTFEYVYTVPAIGPNGIWSETVVAKEGTENTVSDTGVGTFKVTLQPNLVILKSVSIVSDPVNGVVNPKAIPGAVMSYTVLATNQGNGTADAIVITDPIPAQTELYVGDLSGPGTGPVLFTQGAIPSGLTYTFTALNSGTDSISFSNDNGTTWAYTPTPDANGFDGNANAVKVSLSGTFSGASGGSNPSFLLQFRVRVK
jgi:uncharacterized repeat protein (TIGR01451 family)